MTTRPYIRLFASAALSACIIYTSLPAHAALSGYVTISGAVPSTCAIIVTPAISAANITDISIGDTNRLVATVTETCNNLAGYTVTLLGTNSNSHTGLFVDTTSLDSHPFTIQYNGNAVPSGGVVTDAGAPGIGLARPVTITYGTDSTLTATSGFSYEETLTFTIAPK